MSFTSILVLSLFSVAQAAPSYKDLSKATVKIVQPNERSGGTGVVLQSSENTSVILTNHHVCEAIENGGVVITDSNEKYNITSFKESKVHDLCTINVSANLGTNTKVASEHPQMYDEAYVSGHPSLYPTIVTAGHFSKKMIVDIMVGLKACTEEDLNGPDALLCLFVGGKPIIRTLESQVISATIKPGSSGSAVYNSKGELAGLVFAGSGDLGYGMIVPLEYIHNFLETELKSLSLQVPVDTKTISLVEAKTNTKTKCAIVQDKMLKKMCTLLENNMLWVNK
jgi:S1-C subfamily serine protease